MTNVLGTDDSATLASDLQMVRVVIGTKLNREVYLAVIGARDDDLKSILDQPITVFYKPLTQYVDPDGDDDFRLFQTPDGTLIVGYPLSNGNQLEIVSVFVEMRIREAQDALRDLVELYCHLGPIFQECLYDGPMIRLFVF